MCCFLNTCQGSPGGPGGAGNSFANDETALAQGHPQGNKQNDELPLETRKKIDGIIGLLSAEDAAVREDASDDLLDMMLGIEKAEIQLKSLVIPQADPEAISRLRAIAHVLQLREKLDSCDQTNYASCFEELARSGRAGAKVIKEFMETTPNIKVELLSEPRILRINQEVEFFYVITNLGEKSVFVLQKFNHTVRSSGSFPGQPRNQHPGVVIKHGLSAGRIGGSMELTRGEKSVSIGNIIKSGYFLEPGNELRISANENFCRDEVNIYIWRKTISVPSEQIITNDIEGVQITPRNVISSLSDVVTTIVLPEEEDMGKDLKVTLDKNKFKSGDVLEIRCELANDELAKSAFVANLFWYLLVDIDGNPVKYATLEETVPRPDGREFIFKLKCDFEPASYDFIVGFGVSTFSETLKISILEK